MQENSRKINIKKIDVIHSIKQNKAKHQEEYKVAVEAFKQEAIDKIKSAQEALDKGNFESVNINLTRPEDKSEEYDKLILMFEMEVDETVILSQGEFNEYILDENPFAIRARLSNTIYSAKKLI